ncbi:protein of unknown function [Chitinophaga costaii]|uniref:DUF5007 domain-containing protein n=1 Tax=Chitinophaga costaii TaxID=1335309 RepID=A0A1C4DGJ1_9BACT|nr:DUF5007 domain-containing protein [Chitinophaga costaii]PUZ24625.1 DUF5007 domain-containing protein [Chitinophaga costaii]SCC30505.1 protein of unknown function [Chitinophaga costaii]
MKSTIKFFGCALLAIAAAAGCTKVQNGYLSDQIRYIDNPIRIGRGLIQQTDAVSNDGSSAPVTYKLLDIRDAVTHKHADSLDLKYDHYEWLAKFDAKTDTSIDLLNQKRHLVNSPVYSFDTHTGAFTFYGTSVNSPLGTYEFDVSATNENGSKIYKNIATFTLVDTPAYHIGDGGGAWFKDNANDNGDIGVPLVTIERLSLEGTDVILKIVGSDGKPFNPAAGEIIRRGDRSDFQSYAQFHPLVYTDSTMTCNYETTPFPLQQSTYGYLIYYRIPSQFVQFDAGYTPTTDHIYSANPRFQFNIYQSGTYLVTVKLQHVKHI